MRSIREIVYLLALAIVVAATLTLVTRTVVGPLPSSAGGPAATR